jgi:stalled ribosome rescue protein Dom34
LKGLAENIGSNVEIISTETTEGEQFKNLKGIGCLLRFKV